MKWNELNILLKATLQGHLSDSHINSGSFGLECGCFIPQSISSFSLPLFLLFKQEKCSILTSFSYSFQNSSCWVHFCFDCILYFVLVSMAPLSLFNHIENATFKKCKIKHSKPRDAAYLRGGKGNPEKGQRSDVQCVGLIQHSFNLMKNAAGVRARVLSIAVKQREFLLNATALITF